MTINMRNEMMNRFSIKIILLLIFLTMSTSIMEVDAHVPVTYACCYNYISSNGIQLDNFENVMSSDGSLDGTQLDGFENLSNWTVGGTLGYTQEADTANYKEGQQGLKLTAKYGNVATWNRSYSDKVINNNFSTVNNFGFWVYVPNKNTFLELTLYITSNSSNWNTYFIDEISNSHLNNGWNKIIVNKSSDFTTDNNENWNNIMKDIRLVVVPNNGQDANVTFDDLRYNVNTGNWTVCCQGLQEPDTVNFKEGGQGLKLIANGGAGSTVAIDKVINNNFSTTNNFVVWAYIDNASNIGSGDIAIYFTSNGTDTPNGNAWNTFFLDAVWAGPSPGLKTGWNKFVFNKQNFRNYGGENWNNVMNKIRLRIYPAGAIPLNITFDDLRFGMMGQRAKLMITFDDGDASVYNKAYPILNANNQSGVSFVITSWVGTDDSTLMNLSNLKTLQSSGWDISSHTVDHIQLGTVDNATLTSELNGSYDWLVANNFQKSAGFIAYPGGSFNDNVIDYVKKRYVLGRGIMPESAQQHFTPNDDAIRYIQRVIYIENTDSVQSVEDKINNSIDAKLLGILTLHNIVDTNPGTYDYLTTDLRSISNYIKSRSSDVDVITYSDYVIPNINNFTPVINKTTRIYSNGSSILITKNKYDEYMPNMTVVPLAGSIDIGITDYNEINGHVRFNESSSNSAVTYNIGDRIPNQAYNVKIYWANGTLYQNFNIVANSTGYISYNSPGFGNSRYQEIVTVTTNLTVFVRGMNNAIWYQTWNGSAWSGWLSLGGIISSDITATSSGRNITIFVNGLDHAEYYQVWDGNAWSGWKGMGGLITSNPESVSSAGGQYVFVRGGDNAVWYQKWDGSTWSGWQSLGGVISSDITATSSGSNITVFVNGIDNAEYYNAWNGTAWSDWQYLGGIITSNPESVTSAGETYVFVRGGGDNAVYYQKWDGNTWSGWLNLGGLSAGNPEVIG